MTRVSTEALAAPGDDLLGSGFRHPQEQHAFFAGKQAGGRGLAGAHDGGRQFASRAAIGKQFARGNRS